MSMESLKQGVLLENYNGQTEVTMQSFLLKERKIFIFGEIDSVALYRFTATMLSLVTQDPHSPIKIYLNSPGGSVVDGLAICDLITEYKDIIEIYCVGYAYSMGAIILSAGKKGNRYIYPHSQVMIHEPLIPSLSNKSATSLKQTADSIMETKNITVDVLVENTGNSREKVEAAISFDNYMNAKEALDFGIVDHIIE